MFFQTLSLFLGENIHIRFATKEIKASTKFYVLCKYSMHVDFHGMNSMQSKLQQTVL